MELIAIILSILAIALCFVTLALVGAFLHMFRKELFKNNHKEDDKSLSDTIKEEAKKLTVEDVRKANLFKGVSDSEIESILDVISHHPDELNEK